MRLSEFNHQVKRHTMITSNNKSVRYPIGGYAPGNYRCKCVDCSIIFIGDKRAVQCISCAEVFLKTSNEWQNIYPEVKVINPDGWDDNIQYSWHEEKISVQEYFSRRMESVVERVVVDINREIELVAEELSSKTYPQESSHSEWETGRNKRIGFVNGFVDGVKSDVAREYWFKIFNKNL